MAAATRVVADDRSAGRGRGLSGRRAGRTTIGGMTDLRRPWWTLTKTGAVLPPVLEAVVGAFGLVVQVMSLATQPVTPMSIVITVVALVLIVQGVADLVWWGREGRRARAQQG